MKEKNTHLPLRHPTQIPRTSRTAQNPLQLRVSGHHGLNENRAPFWVQPDGQQGGKHLPLPFLQVAPLLRHRDGVQVNNRKNQVRRRRVRAVLHLLPLLQRAEVVA